MTLRKCVGCMFGGIGAFCIASVLRDHGFTLKEGMMIVGGVWLLAVGVALTVPGFPRGQ